MEKTIHAWLVSYTATQIAVDQREASRIVSGIIDWRNSHSRMSNEVLCNYTPRILLPIAHVLVDQWPSDFCLIGFDSIARTYGAPSLDPLIDLLTYGLEERYKTLVIQERLKNIGFFDRLTSDINFEESARALVIEREFQARALATEAIEHVLKQIKQGQIPDSGYYRSAVSAVRSVLWTQLSLWKDEVNHYHGAGRKYLSAVEAGLREMLQHL